MGGTLMTKSKTIEEEIAELDEYWKKFFETKKISTDEERHAYWDYYFKKDHYVPPGVHCYWCGAEVKEVHIITNTIGENKYTFCKKCVKHICYSSPVVTDEIKKEVEEYEEFDKKSNYIGERTWYCYNCGKRIPGYVVGNGHWENDRFKGKCRRCKQNTYFVSFKRNIKNLSLDKWEAL